jgi:hypothetical protein
MIPSLLASVSLALVSNGQAPAAEHPIEVGLAATGGQQAPAGPAQVGSLPDLVWSDVDGDGLVDALGVRAGVLTLWRGGAVGFDDVTAEYGLAGLAPVAAAAFVDFDTDGRRDLFVVTLAGEGVLMRNESGAAFVDVTLASGLAAEGPILKAEWSDLEGDGLPDLVLWTPEEVSVSSNLGGTFETHALDLGPVAVAGAGTAGAGPDGTVTRGGFGASARPASADEPRGSGAGDAGPETGVDGVDGAPPPTLISAGRTAARSVGVAFPSNCAQLLVDLATQTCINASSTPALGQLYPLTSDLNVDAGTGRVGMGTTSPAAKLHVAPSPGERGAVVDGSIEAWANNAPVALLRSNNGQGGRADVVADNGQVTWRMLAQEAASNGPQMDMFTYGGVGTVTLDAEQGSEGAALHLRNAAGLTTLILDGQESSRGAWSRWLTSAGTTAAEVYAESSAGAGGNVHLYNAAGAQTLFMDADSAGGGAGLFLSASDGDFGQLHYAEASDGLGAASYYYADGNIATIVIEAEEVPNDGAQIEMRNYLGNRTIILDADEGNSASELNMYNNAGVRSVLIQSQEGNNDGSQITLYKYDGTASITLDASQGGDARITTETLQITGGADLVESFETDVECRPGSVVAVDPEHPGELTLSRGPYDPRVAGVVSGAGNVKPGLHLGQNGVTSGDTPVALTGRVFVRCSNENGPVRPGDLLTSSSTPGVAMRATDPERSFGAVIGKAMGALEGESGLVLVLVGLQ